MVETEIVKEDDLKSQVLDLTENVGQLEISDKGSFDRAGEYLYKLKLLRTRVVEYFKPLKAATHKAHKALTQREKDELAPIDSADRIVRDLRRMYADVEEAKRQKEQDRLDALAKKKAEREEAKLLKKADKAESSEEKEEFEQRAKDVYVPPNIASGTVEKTTRHEGGGSTTWVKDIEVLIDHEAILLSEIMEGNVPLSVVEIKHAKLKAWVKANDIKNGQIKGIRIIETKRERVSR